MPFVNPYNFISLRNGSKKEYSCYTEGKTLLTGKLECRLTTKTPVIIPDHEKAVKNSAGYTEYPFMTVNGTPMIPGSSLRGVIRSTFEAITDSCVFTNDDYYFSSRTGEAKSAGLLKKVENGWELYRAARYSDIKCSIPNTREYAVGEFVPSFSGYNGKRENTYYISKLGSGNKSGFVMRMNKMQKNSGNSIFELLDKKPLEKFHRDYNGNDNIQITVFFENIKKYKEGMAKDKAIAYEKKLRCLKVGDMIPVWYEYSEGNYYFALSQLSRNIYTKKPKNILQETYPTLSHCVDSKNICPACSLFGFVSGDGNGEALGSRVRFSDACTEDNNAIEEKSILLPFLASPKSSSLEFYLRYNSDFYHADTPGVSLSGRKFYWHNADLADFDASKLKVDKNLKMPAYSYMHYAKPGTTFKFEVFFDQITENQLSQLYTALTFGDSPNGTLCHKVGHAKPIGFGSVKITAEKAVVRSFNAETGYSVDDNYQDKITTVALPPDVKIAADFTGVSGKNIDYPRDEKDKIFGWFSKNRPPADKGKAKFFSKLPLTSIPNQELPDNPKCDQNSTASNRATRPQRVNPAPAPVKNSAPGVCPTCGAPTKINSKTGRHYEYCYKHNPYFKK